MDRNNSGVHTYIHIHTYDTFTHYTISLMDNIFSNKNEENRESVEKLNLDDLYDQKKQEDLAKLYTFNRILTRVHDKIKVAARQKNSQQFCWFLVP